MRKKQLLKQLKQIQNAFVKAPLSWLYNNDGVERNSVERVFYYLTNTAKLVRLLPDLIKELEK